MNETDEIKDISQAPESRERPWISRHPKAVRIIAVVLAAVMVGQLVLYNASAVRFSREKYADSEYETLADYLGEDDEYMTASRLDRMRLLLGLMGQLRTYDDYSMAASVAIADEDYARAAELLQNCVLLFEGTDEAYAELQIKLGCVYGLMGQWKNALQCFRTAANRAPESENAWLLLAEAGLRSEDYAEAVDALETYGAMEALTSEQYSALVSMQLLLGRAEDAAASCTAALALGDPERETEFLYARAQAYMLLGEADLAVRDTEACTAAGGDPTENKLLAAASYDIVGRYGEALGVYRELLEQNPEDMTLLQQAVECAYLAGEDETMHSLALQGREMTAQSDAALSLVFLKWIGVADLELENYDAVEEELTLYIEQNPEAEPEVYYLRGLGRMSRGEYLRATEDFTAGMESEELKDECLYNRALSYLWIYYKVFAARDFEEILTRNSDPQVVQMVKDFLELE